MVRWLSFYTLPALIRFPKTESTEVNPVALISRTIGRELTSSEVHCLYDNFIVQADSISRNTFHGSILGLYRKIENCVKSTTVRNLKHTSYYFDGPLPNAYGQSTNTLQYVHYHCQLFCAKIGQPADMLYELEVSEMLYRTVLSHSDAHPQASGTAEEESGAYLSLLPGDSYDPSPW